MVWRRCVVRECLFLKLTPRSFLGGSKLYSLCEGLDRMELRAYHIRTCGAHVRVLDQSN